MKPVIVNNTSVEPDHERYVFFLAFLPIIQRIGMFQGITSRLWIFGIIIFVSLLFFFLIYLARVLVSDKQVVFSIFYGAGITMNLIVYVLLIIRLIKGSPSIFLHVMWGITFIVLHFVCWLPTVEDLDFFQKKNSTDKVSKEPFFTTSASMFVGLSAAVIDFETYQGSIVDNPNWSWSNFYIVLGIFGFGVIACVGIFIFMKLKYGINVFSSKAINSTVSKLFTKKKK